MAHIQPLVAPTLKNTKGSCAAPTRSGKDIGEITQCELLVEDSFTPRVVVLGKVFEEATTLQNVARPLLIDEVITVVEAFQTFIAWPRHLFQLIPELPVRN